MLRFGSSGSTRGPQTQVPVPVGVTPPFQVPVVARHFWLVGSTPAKQVHSAALPPRSRAHIWSPVTFAATEQ